jgi:flagellar protein FlaI
MNSYLLEERISLMRGIPPSRKREIYAELTRRANVLRRLHKEKVEDFYELYQVLSKAYREGVFR